MVIRLRLFRTISYADVASVISWVVFFASLFGDVVAKKNGLWDPGLRFSQGSSPDFQRLEHQHRDIAQGLRAMFSGTILFYTSLYAVKVAFLLQYFSIFPKNRWKLRLVLVFLSCFVVLGGFAAVSMNLFWCLPVSRNWSVYALQFSSRSCHRWVYH